VPDLVYDVFSLQSLSDAIGVPLVLSSPNFTEYHIIPRVDKRSGVVADNVTHIVLNVDAAFNHVTTAIICIHPYVYTGSLVDPSRILLAGKKGKSRQRAPSRRQPKSRAISRPGNNFFEKEDRVQRGIKMDFQVVRFQKIVEGSTIVTNTVTPTFKSFFFTASDILDFNDLASVFDQYKLEYVEARLVPNITEAISSTPLSAKNYSCIDYDDANAFTSLNDPVQYSNCHVWEPTDPIQVAIQPRFAYAAFATGVFSSFANSKPRWIDCASPGVQHYGLKFAFGPGTTAVAYTVQFRYTISFRMSH
jgi:hypothetical protein